MLKLSGRLFATENTEINFTSRSWAPASDLHLQRLTVCDSSGRPPPSRTPATERESSPTARLLLAAPPCCSPHSCRHPFPPHGLIYNPAPRGSGFMSSRASLSFLSFCASAKPPADALIKYTMCINIYKPMN